MCVLPPKAGIYSALAHARFAPQWAFCSAIAMSALCQKRTSRDLLRSPDRRRQAVNAALGPLP